MCGRFTLTVVGLGEVGAEVGAAVDPALSALWRPRYNIAPGDQHWILRSAEGRRELVPARWGLVNHWARDASVGVRQINARAETLRERLAFREAYFSRRCLLPADGFYEWHGPRGARQPVWFHAPDRSVLWLAGLYESWTDPQSGARRPTFTIITTRANEQVAPVHDRMPAIVPAPAHARWLEGEPPDELLVPAPAGRLAASPASPRGGSVTHDDHDLLDPVDPRLARQLKLF